jgi:hypothetical protein
MADWMDELKNSIDDEKRQKQADEAEKHNRQMSLRNLMVGIFRELHDIVKAQVPTLNHKLYGAKRELLFDYINHTITGNHFLILLKNLRYHVHLKAEENKIACDLEYYFPQTRNYVPHTGVQEFYVTTDGNSILLVEDGRRSATTTEELSQRLLSTIVRAAEVQS